MFQSFSEKEKGFLLQSLTQVDGAIQVDSFGAIIIIINGDTSLILGLQNNIKQ